MAKRKLNEEVAARIRGEIPDGRVGYGSPPKQTQFQKGVSGNPAGRPRKGKSRMDPAMRDAVLADGKRMVAVQDKDGQPSEISARDVLLRAQFKSGAKGNAYAQESYLRRYERAEVEDREYIESRNAMAELYVAEGRREIEEARKAGRPEPELVPHPDDIVIEPGKLYDINGPATTEALEHYERACALREICHMKHILAERSDPVEALYRLAEFFIINAQVPERMQLSDDALFFSPYRRMRSRDLSALIRKTCLELGIPTN